MQTPYSALTRRQMLKQCGCGFGYLALAGIFAENAAAAGASLNPLATKLTHFPPRAKRVIFLFMHGGPSHLDTFDPKPLLFRDEGKTVPKGIQKGVADPNGKLLPSRFAFKKSGQSGVEVSSVLPEVAKCIDDICVVRSMHTDGQDHGQAVLSLHTGSNNQVRPSMGSWITYGLGSENQNLPGFVTISPSQLTGGVQNFGSAFLPAAYQGTPIGQTGLSLTNAQIRHIKNPEMSASRQRKELDFIQQLNQDHLAQAQMDAQIEGVIESYELAFRMQAEAPRITNISDESKATLDLYGVDEQPTDNFARQCLLARRFAESGVRFIQVSHSFKWDQHANLTRDTERNCREVDKPIAGLLRDLKSRGLLKDTLVLWGGEFGRTPTAQGKDGRDHNPHGFSMWMAGGGVKGGSVYGATDDYGYYAAEDKMHMHDLHATILYALGLDHEKLTYRYAGRDFRLTDVHGHVAKGVFG